MIDLADFRARWEPYMLSVLRIVVGLLFMEHGLSKMFNFPPQANHTPYMVMSWVPGLAGILETVGGLLIVLGLFTRPVAFILSGEMAIAYFWSHAPRSFYPLLNAGDAAVLYCFIFLYFAVAGAGAWSLDRLWEDEPRHALR